MQSGFNATRRSRNIGTAKQGHGQNNRLVVPSICYAERSWQLQLRAHQKLKRIVCGRELIFVIEKLSAGFEHACSVDDICQMLEIAPAADWAEIGCFVLRQPTLKQHQLHPAWGRMFYYGSLGPPNKPDIYSGPLVILESQNWSRPQKWSTSMSVEWRNELARLEQDGHKIERQQRHLKMTSTKQSVRATQLYRTLLHEIGHWHDYQQKVEWPVEREDADYDALSDAYFARPSSEREAFAHRYADNLRLTLEKAGRIPFSLGS